MHIVQATETHLQDVARLFDLYRQFYSCEPDFPKATAFIEERIRNNESTVFIALEGDSAQGFVQLYPSFCSVDAVAIYILYDLYVDAAARNSGAGARLMNRAEQFAREKGAARIDLLTGHSNKAGQHLYEKLGYKRANEDFHAYSLAL